MNLTDEQLKRFKKLTKIELIKIILYMENEFNVFYEIYKCNHPGDKHDSRR